MSYHTILVAFTVAGENRSVAQNNLMSMLPKETKENAFPAGLDSWYIAEDDRVDGSDYPSATFIPYKPVKVREDRLQRLLSAVDEAINWAADQDEEYAPDWVDDLVRVAKDLRNN